MKEGKSETERKKVKAGKEKKKEKRKKREKGSLEEESPKNDARKAQKKQKKEAAALAAAAQQQPPQTELAEKEDAADVDASVAQDEAGTTTGALEDKNIECLDCGTTFIFTVRSQEYFLQQGFPASACKRCMPCKEAKKWRHTKGEEDDWAGGAEEGSWGGDDRGAGGKTKGSSGWFDELVASKSIKTRCYNCGKKGHASENCPKEQGATACYKCGKEGHLSRACPSEKPFDVAAARCFNCGGQGHVSKDCSKASGSTACFKCGKEGHAARFCRSAGASAAVAVDEERVEAMVAQRKALRESGDYKGADDLRAELKQMGVALLDGEGSWSVGAKAKKKKPAACFAFQKGECQHGWKCHFAHND